MSAAEPTMRLVRAIDADQLDAPTPCTDYNVRGLINHLLFWAPTLLAAGRKELMPPPADNDRDMDLTGGDWAAKLVASIKDLATTWGAPTAWDGMTRMGSPTEMPATIVGGMVLGERV
ncbi:MAG: maleylpyruvate isomerase N-terminal domain-containing protein, partial [Sciscionella sp.]|nr:maleylpyruvate isomerase N-terminal domain-containing protein [Sciscionella sp.]